MTSGHVLFAANVDDFHSLTKKFIPELADQLAGIVAKNKNTYHQPVKHFKPVSKTEETDQDSLYKPSQESEEPLGMISKPAYFEPKEYDMRIMSNNSSEDSSASNIAEYADAMQKDEESEQYEENPYANVNVETEAVEKSESENEEMETEVGLRNPRTSFKNVQQERPRSAKKKKVRTVQVNLEQLVEKVKERILRDMKPEIDKGLKKSRIKGNTKLTKLVKRPTDYAIRPIVEELKEKTQTIKKGKNNDWYEKDPRLVGKSKIKPKIHVNDKVNNQRPRKPVQSQAKEDKNEEIIEDDILTKLKLSTSKKKDSYEDYVAPKREQDIFESNEPETPKTLQEIRFKQQTQKDDTLIIKPVVAKNKETIKTTPEYDDYQETTTKGQLNARTENIGDYDDHKLIDNNKITSQKTKNKLKTKDVRQAKEKEKKSKLGTMIPTREIYKMSSPDYYGKLPKIAERYKFDEPIPFKDMEDENLKPVGNPPANINGKIRM